MQLTNFDCWRGTFWENGTIGAMPAMPYVDYTTGSVYLVADDGRCFLNIDVEIDPENGLDFPVTWRCQECEAPPTLVSLIARFAKRAVYRSIDE
jgi:hypothetical protein